MKVKNAVGQHTGILPEVDLVCEQIRRLFIATMRERFHGVWLVCHRHTRGSPWGLMGCRKRAREAIWDVVSLSQKCKKGSSHCGWSIADVNERILMVMQVCRCGVRGGAMGAGPKMLHTA